MATFAYRTTSGAGGGTVEAPDRAAAVRGRGGRGAAGGAGRGGARAAAAGGGEHRGGIARSPGAGDRGWCRRRSARLRGPCDSATAGPWCSRGVMGRGEMAALVRELATAL